MGSKPDIPKGLVTRQIMMGWMCVALIAGFLGGMVFGIYKSTPSAPQRDAGMPPGTPQQPDTAALENRIPEMEKQAADNPDNAEGWIRLGNLYFDTHKIKKAIGAYEKALALSSKNSDVWTDLGVMYRRDGQPRKALEAFDTAIKVDPKHEISRFNKGIVLLHDMNDREGALRAWESLVQVNPFAMAPNGQSVDQMVQALKQSGNQSSQKQ